MTPDEIAAVPVESKSCPACSVHSQVLAECAGCKSFVCLTKDCLAFELDEPKQCFQHSNEIYCKACLCGAVEGNSTGSPDPFLRKCPSDGCDRWMCKSNWKWCLGEPIDAVKVITTDDANSSDKEEFNDERPEQPRTKKQKLGQQPRHDRRLALCSICLEDLPPDQSWQSCDSFQGCWSNPTGSGCICPECLTEGGIECVGGHYWICYSCSEKSFPRVWPCPSCENSFCRQCKVVDRCQGCGLSQMCKDCKLENSNAEPGGADTDVELVSECTDCSDYLLCQTCSNRLTNYCGACGDRVCEECAADTCIECEKSICQRCAKGFPECSCGGAWREIRPKEG
ncbi:hypothetical protein BDP27DRAFT_1328563 [Rhodocollybia butyracea]|uniref:Uncharacterized protein n=1 Tax=Rhodocollybia butyracea TaxID=206335 RepID=A0A9P5PKZ7_9AGAR|nr:hypothetical protein BDP27DRAFT_1328563 [Rhodocollybia butyracea]